MRSDMLIQFVQTDFRSDDFELSAQRVQPIIDTVPQQLVTVHVRVVAEPSPAMRL